MRAATLAFTLCLIPVFAAAQSENPLSSQIDRLTQELTPQVVTWRRDFHQHPELGNREQRTAKIIAEELKRHGYEVKTGVAQVPGMFFFLGVTPRDRDITSAPANHSPLSFADESALPVGVRVMANLVLDYLFGAGK
jgi:metal-dependent amidase/aminoacylase/carboxypeptidase family protein